MVKITADLINYAANEINAISDREVDLRGRLPFMLYPLDSSFECHYESIN
jgi:hypothetical protein